MIISYKTQSLNYSQDINNLLCQIDVWLARKSKDKLDSNRFGARICINYQDYKLISKYRKILMDKAGEHCCLKGFLIDDIISRIKQLLNKNL